MSLYQNCIRCGKVTQSFIRVNGQDTCGECGRVYGDTTPAVKTWVEADVEIKKSEDTVNHPSHYNSGKIEVIEAIEDWQLGFHLGNAIKYIARAGKKDPNKIIEDLEKAIWYLRRRIALAKGNPPRPNEMPQDRES